MWNLDRVNQFISDGIEENIHLDYKGAGSISKSRDKKTEISKDVSAFANSDGGIIIYGVREFDDRDKSHLPERLDPINGNEFSKEWLEQVINSTISPRIPEIIITPIQISENEDNNLIYVVEIPKSSTAHQMNDKRYYRRYNFQSIAMEDWEIKDIINRRNTSDVVIKFEKLDNTPFDLIKDWITRKTNMEVRYKIIAHNKGNKVAQMLNIFISGDETTVKYIKGAKLTSDECFELHYSNEIERKLKLDGNEFVIGLERIPIMPCTYRHIGTITIDTSMIADEKDLIIQVTTEDYSKTDCFPAINLIE